MTAPRRNYSCFAFLSFSSHKNSPPSQRLWCGLVTKFCHSRLWRVGFPKSTLTSAPVQAASRWAWNAAQPQPWPKNIYGMTGSGIPPSDIQSMSRVKSNKLGSFQGKQVAVVLVHYTECFKGREVQGKGPCKLRYVFFCNRGESKKS